MGLLSRFLACLGLGFFLPAAASDFFVSASQGYTHYSAGDLNQVLVLLEETTQQNGFNNYQVNGFDGHPENALELGWQSGLWRWGLEAEFWVETFSQHEVPFDLRNAERANTITCAQIRNSTDFGNGLYGCVEAQEAIQFLPITLQVSRSFYFGPHFRLSPGYGLGILAGSSHIGLSTQYFGQGAVPNDAIRFEAWPGVNPVHKLFCDWEWRPLKHWGLEARGGWRYTFMPQISLRHQQGSSLLFNTVFHDAGENARLYIQETGQAGQDQLYLGTPSQAAALAASTGTRLHAVEGDFNGWFGAIRVNFYLRGLP